jgi:hypothetical protein
MVGKNSLELCLVCWFQQIIKGTSRQFGKCLVSWGKDGKGARSFEGGYSIRCRQRGGEGFKRTSSNRSVNDVFLASCAR